MLKLQRCHSLPELSEAQRIRCTAGSEVKQDSRETRELHRPSKELFLCRVYVIVLLAMLLASLQWVGATYHWQPNISINERNFFMLMMVLACLNMTLGFLGFRRLQFSFPANWLVFICICESLVLLFVCMYARELELTWEYVLTGLVVISLYTAVGFWVPQRLTPQLWTLIFMSMMVVLSALVVLITGLAMRIYVPLTFIIVVFGPWAMHNSQMVHGTRRIGYSTHQHMEAALKMYLNFACTVGGICLIMQLTIKHIEVEHCMQYWFCRKSMLL